MAFARDQVKELNGYGLRPWAVPQSSHNEVRRVDGAGRREGQERAALLGDRRFLRGGQRTEQLDHQRRGTAGPLDPPGATDEAVDEHRTEDDAVDGENHPP